MADVWERARAVPLRAVPRVARQMARRQWRGLTAPRAPRKISDQDFLRALKPPTRNAQHATRDEVADVVEHFRRAGRPRLFLPTAEIIEGSCPGATERLIAQAGSILAHRFDLLGSGLTDLASPIEWRRDFKAAHTWALQHHTRLRIVDPRAGFDVKVPWELSRFHHGVALAQAYAVTGLAVYAEEFAAQVESWLADNPAEFGPNWANAMEAAIRAANWLAAYDFLAGSPSLTADFHLAFLKSLLQHGRYIGSNLEQGWPGSNHYLADLCGLVWLGALLPEFREAEGWLRAGLSGLARELPRQVYEDGGDYEASTGYHCLVTEMVLWALFICRQCGVAAPPIILDRLERMLEVLAGLLKPDGSLPAFGDLDSGRWLVLESDRNRLPSGQDPQGLLALGALLFERDDWEAAAGNRREAALWVKGLPASIASQGYRKARAPAGNDHAPPGALHVPRSSVHGGSLAFAQAGWYVMRDGDRYLAVEAGGNGADGWGLHAHNDALSFELAAGRRSLLVDPGSYVYTGDFRARNDFRATAAHNTLTVDGQEINAIPAQDMFRLENEAQVNVLRWESDVAHDLFEAEHTGFLRAGALHRRQIYFDRRQGFWLVRDLVVPAGRSRGRHAERGLEIFFHFAPLPVVADGLAVRTACDSGLNLLILPLRERGLALSQSPGWVSPRYGVRVAAPVARYTAKAALPAEFVFALWLFEGEVVPGEVRAKTEPVCAYFT